MTPLELIASIVPILVSGAVALYTNTKIQDLKEEMSHAKIRIARLEQILIDNHLPVPPEEPLVVGKGS